MKGIEEIHTKSTGMRPFFLQLFLLFSVATCAQDIYLLIGTYDSPKSEGIYLYRFNTGDGTATPLSHVKTANPSYLSVSPDKKMIYAVAENASNGKGGEVAAFRFDAESGTLQFINKQSTGGDHPCYVECDRTGNWIFAGNYTSGSVSVLKREPDGRLSSGVSVIPHRGSGPDTVRQKGPHVHCTYISPDNRHLFVPDLGTDKIWIYRFNEKTGQLTPGKQPYAGSDPGSGPRHFILHPGHKTGYLVEELSGTVVVYRNKNGRLKRLQRISTMPAGDASFPGSADIHVSPDGRFLYASNRGTSNTIAVYRISKKGTLSLAGHQSTLGRSPRNFTLDPSGKWLLAGNQNSDEVVIFERDAETGLMRDSGHRITVGKPVCLKWVVR